MLHSTSKAGADGAGRFWVMRATRRILAAVFVVLGALLVAKGVMGGVWPLSIQLIAGVALLVFGVLRWRYSR